MNKIFHHLLLIIRLILGIIFIISAIYKFSSPIDFAQSILNYQVFGFFISHLGAIIIPTLEAVVGILLLTGFWLKEAIILTVCLYVVFDVMVIQAYVRGLDVACGCFDPTNQHPIDIQKLMENFFLTALAFGAFILDRKKNCQQ